jgi:uncharacterized protein (TIGR02246 family)
MLGFPNRRRLIAMSDEVERLYRRLLEAWNAHDGDAMAACFAEDGEMIGFDGSHVQGRTEIAEHLNSVFADHETAAFIAKIRSVRSLTSDVALLRAAAGMVPPGGSDINPAANTHHTVVAEKLDGEWRIALFQNTPAQFHGRPEQTKKWTEELRALI